MSIDRIADGEIAIDPPLTHAEVRRYHEWQAAAKEDRYRRDLRDVVLDVWDTTEDTDQGLIRTESASLVLPRDTSSFWSRSYTEADLRELIEMYPDHTFSGFIEVESEGYGEDHEVVRYVAKGHELHEVRPVVTWPEV